MKVPRFQILSSFGALDVKTASIRNDGLIRSVRPECSLRILNVAWDIMLRLEQDRPFPELGVPHKHDLFWDAPMWIEKHSGFGRNIKCLGIPTALTCGQEERYGLQPLLLFRLSSYTSASAFEWSLLGRSYGSNNVQSRTLWWFLLVHNPPNKLSLYLRYPGHVHQISYLWPHLGGPFCCILCAYLSAVDPVAITFVSCQSLKVGSYGGFLE